MTKIRILSVVYSSDLKLKATVVAEESRLFVDFYKGETFIETTEVLGHSIRYAEDIAENYVLGIVKINADKMEI